MRGGVCLNVGCIPSKALLHAAHVIDEAEAMAEHGIQFGKPEIDAEGLRAWKNKVADRLTGGLTQLAKQRKVSVIQGVAKFASAKHLVLDNGETIGFNKCMVVTKQHVTKESMHTMLLVACCGIKLLTNKCCIAQSLRSWHTRINQVVEHEIPNVDPWDRSRVCFH